MRKTQAKVIVNLNRIKGLFKIKSSEFWIIKNNLVVREIRCWMNNKIYSYVHLQTYLFQSNNKAWTRMTWLIINRRNWNIKVIIINAIFSSWNEVGDIQWSITFYRIYEPDSEATEYILHWQDQVFCHFGKGSSFLFWFLSFLFYLVLWWENQSSGWCKIQCYFSSVTVFVGSIHPKKGALSLIHPFWVNHIPMPQRELNTRDPMKTGCCSFLHQFSS
jgi:hypothetical protein